MAENTKKTVAGTLQNAYPGNDPQPGQNNDEELKKLSQALKDTQDKLTETEKENKELKDKLDAVEKEKLKTLAEQVATLKVSKGLLTEELKEKEVEKLSKLAAETLSVLHEELSAVQVKLTQNPAAGPAEGPPGQQTDEEKRQTEIKQMRMKMFGHEEDPYEFYNKEFEAGRL